MMNRPNGPTRLTAIRSVNAAVIFRFAHGPANAVIVSMMVPMTAAAMSAERSSIGALGLLPPSSACDLFGQEDRTRPL